MSRKPSNRPNLPLFFTVMMLSVILVALFLLSLSSNWGTAYGSTIPIPQSPTPTTTESGPNPTTPTTTTQPGSSPSPAPSVTPVITSTTSPSPTPPATTPANCASEMVTLPAGASGFADEALWQVWQRTDSLVANGSVVRTWLWGPGPDTPFREEYGGGSGCQRRLVQYFEKSRMEISNPGGDHNSQWFVTNGLLAKELISGNMQVGDNAFVQRQPAQVPVAGDQNDPNGPTYADLAKVTTLAPGQNVTTSSTGNFVNSTLVKGQGARQSNLGELYKVRYTNFDAQSGHNIAGPLWDFLNSTGPVVVNGQTITGKLFDPIFFATGLPLSEAYWVRARVGGVVKDVLVQVFERRVLTYTPSNPAQWQVEMGNIGQHYYKWRYGA